MHRKELVLLYIFLTSISALSIDIIIPAFTDIGTYVGVANDQNLQLIVIVFIGGMFFGELGFGWLSDHSGRKIAIALGIAIFIGGSLIASLADSFALLLAGRFIQGIGVAGPKIATRALIRDQFKGDQMASIMSQMLIFFILLPLIAPTLGHVINTKFSWEWIFYFLTFYSLTILIWFWTRQEETLVKSLHHNISSRSTANAIKSFMMNQKVMLYTIISGLIFGFYISFISISALLFRDIYGINDDFFLYFSLLTVSLGIASFSNSHLVKSLSAKTMLMVGLSGMVFSSLVLVTIASTNSDTIGFSYFMTFMFLCLLCCGFVFGNIQALAMEPVGGMAGLGSALISSISTIIAILVSLGVGRVYEGSLYNLFLSYLVIYLTCIVLAKLAVRSQLINIGYTQTN